jgi:hypothetical protein
MTWSVTQTDPRTWLDIKDFIISLDLHKIYNVWVYDKSPPVLNNTPEFSIKNL